ncbi:MAG: heme lyase CcmF/NrfE family subunit [Trueperaceae bacterium]|nr:heme lyase CcmF/NrfE family subunit [Trueperaceae bacterium]
MLELSLGHIGTASVMLALGVAVYAVVCGVLGAVRHDARLQTSARYAAVASFLALTTAALVMQTALLNDDFSVKYVAEHSSINSPLWVKVVTMWAALEGSVLLWAWLLSGYTALLALVAPNSPLRPWALVVMNVVLIFFVSVNAIVANPFIVLANPPLNGPGPNPLLQNHWMMAIHPVLMYLGFVGLTVPFAYAMAALITKRPGSEWMSQTRAWTLTGWGFLGVAKIAGGWWSYEVLGWGGYWAWDPVENVSLLPWLTATAFIHSVQVQERRRMLKAWNLLLIILTFALTILGTFIIRSGVVTSVHAFGDGPVGPYFLGFFILVMLSSFGLLALRWDQVRDRAELDSPVSREGSFLLGNVLFLAMAFAVLLGTLFPLLVEAISGDKVTVGAPFFNQVSIPIWLAIFALMGIGPLLPWRKAKTQSLMVNLGWMVGGGVLAGGVAYALGVQKIYPMLTVALAGYNLVSLWLLIAGAVRPRAKATGKSVATIFKRYAFENRRRFGSMIVHFAVIVMALGVAGSGGYRVDQQVSIEFGSSVPFRGYELHAVDRFMEQTPGRISAGAVIEVWRDGRQVTTLRPRISVFGQNQQPVPTPAVMYRPLHDLYLNVSGAVGPDQDFVVVRVVQSPLVSWIWFGALLLAAGVAYSLWPNPQPVTRTQKGAVPA